MKLMFVIVSEVDNDRVVQVLVENDFRVTRVASSGGFLRRGNVTLLLGVEADKVQPVMDLLHKTCPSSKSDQHSATVFVVDMPYFEQI